MRIMPLADFLVELAKPKLRSARVRFRRAGLAHIAKKMPTELLDDTRIAATDELARRGYHLIMPRPRSRKKVA